MKQKIRNWVDKLNQKLSKNPHISHRMLIARIEYAKLHNSHGQDYYGVWIYKNNAPMVDYIYLHTPLEKLNYLTKDPRVWAIITTVISFIAGWIVAS